MPVKRPKAADALSPPTRKDLARRQTAAKAYTPSDPRIVKAWNRFSGTKARAEVEDRLDVVFHTKCAYCENIVPKDIEHFFPKSKYPKRMFTWENFLLSCKNCNNNKRDTFELLKGSPVLLDPCSDEPSEFLTWDLDSGMPILSLDGAKQHRARATVDLFQLDNQQLCDQRRRRATHFLFILVQSIEEPPTPPDVHRWLLDELKVTHPWRSVLRQIVRDPATALLVDQVKKAVPAAAPLLTELAA